MIGRRSGQLGLFEGDHLWLEHVGRQSFYGLVALHRAFLFNDEDFASMFSPGGRPSVPPSLLATALLLQLHDGVSDDEARERACFDARWKVALGLEMENRPFSTSTLRAFRQQMADCASAHKAFARVLTYVRNQGYLISEGADAAARVVVEAIDGHADVEPAARAVPRIAVTEAAW
jgi:hypothetical protein